MLWLVARRLALAVPLMLVVSVATFALMRAAPGDPASAIASQNASLEQIAQIREQLGLNRPLHEQYLDWAGKAVRGDLGTSLFTSQHVLESIADRLPPTLSLTLVATTLSVLIGVPAGMISAIRRGSLVDRGLTVLSSVGLAIPSFWLGLVLVLVFVARLGWFPAIGYVGLTDDPLGWARSMALPSVALAVPAIGVVARQTRSALLDVMQQEYVTAARARGLGPRRVLIKHGMKNAAIPIVTIVGLQLVTLLGGSVIIEQVFAIQGVGSLAVNAVSLRDIYTIQGIVVLTALMVVVVNLIVDLLYGYCNPRVRGR